MLQFQTLGAVELRKAGVSDSAPMSLQPKRLALLSYLAATALPTSINAAIRL